MPAVQHVSLPMVMQYQKEPIAKAARFEIFALAASAGGIEAIFAILNRLPILHVPVIIILHRSPDRPSCLAKLLAKRTGHRVKEAVDGDELRGGVIYLAPPGRHMLITQDFRVRLNDAPRVMFCRPSADVTLASVAHVYGEQAAAIVLSGANRDGANGIKAIRKQGGFAIVQSEETCHHTEMPRAALEQGGIDLVLSPDDIADAMFFLSEFV